MSADYADTLQMVQNLIAQGVRFGDAWPQLAAHLKAQADPPLDLPELDLEREFWCLEDWLLEVLTERPPSRTIRGLRFGLYHPDRNGRPGCDIYLAGSRSFEADSTAWGFDSHYQAPGEPRSPALDALNEVAFSELHQDDAGVVHVCLWFALLAVAELCRKHSPAMRGTASRRGVGVGHDSGDLIVIGVHTARGFQPQGVDKPARTAKRPKLPAGDYFKIEGGRDVLLCESMDTELSDSLFRRPGHIEPVQVTAEIDPDWPDQLGTFGSLEPFSCAFIPAAVADQITAAFPNEVQFHALRIEGRPERWSILKILNCVDCLNQPESKRTGLTLRRQPIANRHFFFVKGYYEGGAIFVSRAAAELLIAGGVTGIEFIRTNLS